MSSAQAPQPHRSHSTTSLTSYLPSTPTPLTHANPQHPTTHAQAHQLGQVKPRAKSFYDESFHYSSLPRPLEEDDSEDEDEEDAVVIPNSRMNGKTQGVGSVSSKMTHPIPEAEAATATTTAAEERRVFHNLSFNYQSFKPLFNDTDDEDSGSDDEEDAVGGKVAGDAGLLDTPPLVAQRMVDVPVEGLKLERAAGGSAEEIAGGVRA